MKSSNTQPPYTLHRSETNRMIAGVAGGLGEYFTIDPVIIRIIFIILTIFHGSGILIYLIMWILLPVGSKFDGDHNMVMKNNIDEIKDKAHTFAHNLRFNQARSVQDSRFWWAVLIIAVGFFFLFRNFGILNDLDLGRFWPLILILLGIIFIIKR